MSQTAQPIVKVGKDKRAGHSDSWGVYLDHQCESWDITGENSMGSTHGVPHAEAVAELESFIQDATEALAVLKARATR